MVIAETGVESKFSYGGSCFGAVPPVVFEAVFVYPGCSSAYGVYGDGKGRVAVVEEIQSAWEVFVWVDFFVKIFEVEGEFFLLAGGELACIEGSEEGAYFLSAEGFYGGVVV